MKRRSDDLDCLKAVAVCSVLIALGIVLFLVITVMRMKEAHECEARGGILLRATWSWECVKVERK